MRGESDAKAPKAARVEPRIHRMLAHPLRYGIMMILGDRQASPTEIANALGEPLKRVSEQIEILVKESMVELVSKGPGEKGGVRRVYRATDRPVLSSEEWAALPKSERETSSLAIYRVLHKDVVRSLQSGAFDSHANRVLIRDPWWVDDLGVEEIDDILIRAHGEIRAVAERALQRRQAAGDPPTRVMIGLLSFPMAPESSDATAE